MNNIYYFETNEECEKAIIDKTINLDIMHSSCTNILDSFVNIIKCIIIWVSIFIMSILWIKEDFKYALRVVAPFIIVYIFGKFIIYAVKRTHFYNYQRLKIRLVDGLINNCKEYQESNYEDWERKQILKRFASLANLEVNLDNAK